MHDCTCITHRLHHLALTDHHQPGEGSTRSIERNSHCSRQMRQCSASWKLRFNDRRSACKQRQLAHAYAYVRRVAAIRATAFSATSLGLQSLTGRMYKNAIHTDDRADLIRRTLRHNHALASIRYRRLARCVRTNCARSKRAARCNEDHHHCRQHQQPIRNLQPCGRRVIVDE